MTSNETGSSSRWHRVIALAAGVSFIGFGAWAMLGPESFFDALARFEPYNQHFIQDIGSFQIGLGAVLVLAGLPSRADGLAMGLTGVGIGSVAHTISHVVGHDLGGTPALDIPLLAALSVVLLVAGLLRWREVAMRTR